MPHPGHLYLALTYKSMGYVLLLGLRTGTGFGIWDFHDDFPVGNLHYHHPGHRTGLPRSYLIILGPSLLEKFFKLIQIDRHRYQRNYLYHY